MTPISFKQQTTVLGKNQPPFLPLPCYMDEKETISHWRLSWSERLKVLIRGRIWLRQCNFEQKLQAQSPTVDTPFVERA